MKILDDQRKKFTHKDVARFFKDWNKTMQYYFTDLDEYYVIELIDGNPKPLVKEKFIRKTYRNHTRKSFENFKSY